MAEQDSAAIIPFPRSGPPQARLTASVARLEAAVAAQRAAIALWRRNLARPAEATGALRGSFVVYQSGLARLDAQVARLGTEARQLQGRMAGAGG
jgi:hypothetical protein